MQILIVTLHCYILRSNATHLLDPMQMTTVSID